jgi:glucosyl-3-phosphoglycerate phosphatase
MRVMNHLSGVDRLANRYRVMRHGQSKANVDGVIVSRIEHDRRGDYGLSEPGRDQVLAAPLSGLPPDTVICSSDFSRAWQTAQIVRARLGAPEVVPAEALRERYFGDWEGSSTDHYAQVWAGDEAASGRASHHVEPAGAVLGRTTELIVDLERRYQGRDILLVSHGDPLQILQAGFMRIDPSRHRSVPHLEPAEIRPLYLAARLGGPGCRLASQAGHEGQPVQDAGHDQQHAISGDQGQVLKRATDHRPD